MQYFVCFNELIHLSEYIKFVYLNKMMNIDYIKKKRMMFTYHILSKGLNGAALNLYSNRHDWNMKRRDMLLIDLL